MPGLTDMRASGQRCVFQRFSLSVFLRHFCVFGGVYRLQRCHKGDKNLVTSRNDPWQRSELVDDELEAEG
jgi:hypothetical protein